MKVDKIRAAFDEVSQRHTRPRRLIADRLSELAASVYRSVEKLVTMGLLDRVEFADGTHHYRICGDGHHHHLTCTTCHRVVEVDVCLPIDQITAIGDKTNFDIEGHSLTLFGRCKNCRAQ